MREETIEMTDGWLVHTFIYEPKQPPIGHIHLMHGMAEHIGRYKEFAEYLMDKGYLVTGHDHRGHGKTVSLNGIKGHLADELGFNRAVEDAYEIIKYFRGNYPSLRLILFGHSMGSFIARRYIQKYGEEVDIAIFSGTGGDPGVSLIAAQSVGYFAGKKEGFDRPNDKLNKLVFGGHNKSVKESLTPFDWLSSDPTEVEKYMADPMCGFVPTTRFFLDVFEGIREIHSSREIKKIPKSLPILLFSGTNDPVGNLGKGVWQVARQYQKAGIEDITVLLFEGGRHEMLHEKNRKDVFAISLQLDEIKMSKYPDVIAIVGPTASGKTALSVELAKLIDGEVINGDAMQVYKGIDIGTAKITYDEMDGIPHHMFDTKEPDEPFSVAEYQAEVRKWIKNIQDRGKIPIIAGGTGLYIQSVLYDFRFTDEGSNPVVRERLEQELIEKGSEVLYERLVL